MVDVTAVGKSLACYPPEIPPACLRTRRVGGRRRRRRRRRCRAWDRAMRGGRSLRLLVTACMHTRVAPLLMPATAPKWKGALRKSFQANGGLLYKTNFLSPSTYEEVRNECRSLRRHFKRELDSIATGRLGCCLDSRSQAYLNLMTDDISTALSGVTGLTLFPSDFPVECRLYTPKAAMDWHQDDELYAEPQALTATLSTIHCAHTHTPHIPHAHTHRTRHTARTLLHMHCTPHTAHGTCTARTDGGRVHARQRLRLAHRVGRPHGRAALGADRA